MYVIAQTTPAKPITPETKKLANGMAILIVLVGAFVVVLVISLLLLRIRTYRKAIARKAGLSDDRLHAPPGKHHVDPWQESARRLEVEPDEGIDDDTVEFDTGDLGPDDIEPGDEPRNGKGSH
jgi:hypothetical protein